MNFLVWNIRGLNSVEKQREAKQLIVDNNVHDLPLVETRVRLHNKWFA